MESIEIYSSTSYQPWKPTAQNTCYVAGVKTITGLHFVCNMCQHFHWAMFTMWGKPFSLQEGIVVVGEGMLIQPTKYASETLWNIAGNYFEENVALYIQCLF